MSNISPGTILLGIVAILFGLLGAYIVRQKLDRPEPSAVVVESVEESRVSVPMASTELRAGRKIALSDIGIYRLTKEQMVERGITRSFMNNTQQIIGRILKDDVVQGSPFETSLFYPEGTGPNISELLETGQRALTIPVHLDAAVAGFATPGTWVDVLFRSESDPDKEHPETTVTLLEKVKVLALDHESFEGTQRNSSAPANKFQHVTLAVTPEEMTSLGVVSGRGILSLALRNSEDTAVSEIRTSKTLDELLNIPPPARHRMEIYRGGQLSNVEFKNNGRIGNAGLVKRPRENAGSNVSPKVAETNQN